MELAGLEGDSSLKLLSKYAVVVDLVGTFVAWVQICKTILCKSACSVCAFCKEKELVGTFSQYCTISQTLNIAYISAWVAKLLSISVRFLHGVSLQPYRVLIFIISLAGSFPTFVHFVEILFFVTNVVSPFSCKIVIVIISIQLSAALEFRVP